MALAAILPKVRVLRNAEIVGKKSLWAKASPRLSTPTFDLMLGALNSAAAVMPGEIDGAMEEKATKYVQGMIKAVIAFIADATSLRYCCCTIRGICSPT